MTITTFDKLSPTGPKPGSAGYAVPGQRIYPLQPPPGRGQRPYSFRHLLRWV